MRRVHINPEDAAARSQKLQKPLRLFHIAIAGGERPVRAERDDDDAAESALRREALRGFDSAADIARDFRIDRAAGQHLLQISRRRQHDRIADAGDTRKICRLHACRLVLSSFCRRCLLGFFLLPRELRRVLFKTCIELRPRLRLVAGRRRKPLAAEAHQEDAAQSESEKARSLHIDKTIAERRQLAPADALRQRLRPHGEQQDDGDLPRGKIRHRFPALLLKQEDHGVLPEEDAIAARANPAKDAHIEKLANRHAAIRRDREQQTEQKRHKEHAAPIEQRIRAVEENAREEDGDEQELETDELCDLAPKRILLRRRSPRTPKPHRRSQEERKDARIRAIVKARHICPHRIRKRHEERHPQTERGDDRHARPFPQAMRDKRMKKKEQRPQDECILQLDAHEPQMRKRRCIGDAREIVGVRSNLPPVVIAEHDGKNLLAHVHDRLGKHEGIHAECHENHDDESRIHAQKALQKITSERKFAREPFPLRRVGEKIPRQNKKQGYPEVSPFHHIGKYMKQRDADDRQGAQGIEPLNPRRRPSSNVICHKSTILFVPSIIAQTKSLFKGFSFAFGRDELYN